MTKYTHKKISAKLAAKAAKAAEDDVSPEDVSELQASRHTSWAVTSLVRKPSSRSESSVRG